MIAFLISLCFAALMVIDNLQQGRPASGPQETRQPIDLPRAA